jgi:hypothetical protein
MRKKYDFSGSKPNLHARKLKRQGTIRIYEEAFEYFTTWQSAALAMQSELGN